MPPIDTLLVGVRAVHFVSTLLLLGEVVFVVWVAGAFDINRDSAREEDARWWRARLVRVTSVWLAVSVLSGIAWLMLLASTMSGLPIAEALSRRTLGLVVFETSFGRLWLLRAVLATLIAGLLVLAMRRPAGPAAKTCAAMFALLAAAYAASLAWAGHAVAGASPERDIHLACDVAHLLGAGAWLGALPALIAGLRRLSSGDVMRVTRRFSRLGVAAVAVIAASGVGNAWFLTGDWSLLVGTTYGRVVCAKVALFAAMLVLALINRLRWTPRLTGVDQEARDALRWNAAWEIALGIAVLVLVGALGTMTPASHQRQHPHHGAAAHGARHVAAMPEVVAVGRDASVRMI